MAESETSHDEGGDDSALIRAAAAGDRRAAGEYFAKELPRLSSIARRIAGTSHDGGDLLGEALVTILAKWADGTGPTEYITAYIAQTMRNRMKDDFKSPRSKVRSFDDDDDPEAREDPRIRQIEIEPELELIRRAMLELPEDQQTILTATIVEGLKPRDLQERLDRPMTAIYSLAHRARANLRRATLRLILEKDAPPECYSAAQHLPESVGDTPDGIRGSRFTAHYETCDRCRAAWLRFGALATLGIAPLLVIGDLFFGSPAPAQASTEQQNPDAAQPPPDGSGSRGSASVPSAGVVPAPPGATPAATSPVPGNAAASGAPRPRPSTLMGAAVIVAGVVTATGAAILVFLGVALATQTFWFTPKPTASLTVQAAMPSDSVTRLGVDFDVDGDSWRIRAARITLSEPVGVLDVPDGWVCDSSGRIVTCRTDLADAAGGVIELAHAPGVRRLKYDIEVVAVTPNGATVEATYGDTVRR
ncbi:sigma-70 family RNA polymerase sigma factor [Microbacterium sp. NPDC087868]|uniref:sigma-70 family RNA polymerase sigma factor n=1 Tax=Microbacterium sp. NPDC087868 TaxID=3364195 RepID=UPI00384CB0FE